MGSGWMGQPKRGCGYGSLGKPQARWEWVEGKQRSQIRPWQTRVRDCRATYISHSARKTSEDGRAGGWVGGSKATSWPRGE